MAGQVHHVAVNSANFEQTVHFFEEVFQMEVSRTSGEAPARKLWFRQGIQVSDKAETIKKASAFGCAVVPGKPHWFTTPDGIVIELMA